MVDTHDIPDIEEDWRLLRGQPRCFYVGPSEGLSKRIIVVELVNLGRRPNLAGKPTVRYLVEARRVIFPKGPGLELPRWLQTRSTAPQNLLAFSVEEAIDRARGLIQRRLMSLMTKVEELKGQAEKLKDQIYAHQREIARSTYPTRKDFDDG